MREEPFWQRSKGCFDSPTSLGLFTDMQMISGHKLPLVDQTAPNTPTGNEFSFMSPKLTPKKQFENVPMLTIESFGPRDDSHGTPSTTVVMKAGK